MAEILHPLEWDGSTLAIPRASATQDGYLSKNDWILFAGGAAVPVTSFNTRTGDIVLLEDDVLAALGYVPLNKHGDTMTGPLKLAGPPTDNLHATSKAYVDGIAGPSVAPPATWYVSDFKASGSKLTFTGTASAGATTLTLSVASDFAVGQGILIKGAGSSSSGIPGALLTKVDAIDGTLKIITLHDPVTSAVSAVAGNVQHDDTSAINAAFQAVFDANGGTLHFHPGTYNVNGPVGGANSIIRLPYNATTNPAIAISMIGQPQPGMCFATGGVGPPQYGVIIQTQVHNTSAAIFAATAYFSTITDITWFNNITLFMDGFTFRTYADPQISALDMVGCDNICFRNIQIDAGVPFFSTAALQPTATATYALRAPAISAGMANHYIENVQIFNYYTGLKFSDLLRVNYVEIFRCMVGMEFMQSYYTAYFYSCLVWHCPTTVYISPMPSGCRGVLDMSLTIEYNHISSEWDAPMAGRDLYDPTDVASGVVKIEKVAGNGIGSLGTVSRTGFTKADVFDIGLGQHLTITILGDLAVTGDTSVGSNLSIGGQLVTAGINNSATATGFRELQVANISAAGLLANLTSYWKLDEASGTRADSRGSAPFSPVTTVATAAGRFGTLGASFNATNHLAASHASLQTGSSSDYTVALWVKLDSKSANGDFLCKGDGSSGTADEYIFGYDLGSDRFRFTVAGGTSVFSPNYTDIHSTSAGSPAVGTWYLLIGWFDSTVGQTFLQVNNFGIDSASPVLPLFAGAGGLYVGCYGNAVANGAFATVDEIAFWKGRKPDAAMRAALWNGGAGTPFSSWT